MIDGRKILFLVSEDWYFRSHRLPVARAARDAGAEVVVATRVRDAGEAIRAEGFRLVPIEMARSGRNPMSDLVLLLRLFRLYRAERPDIVHHVALKPILYGGIAAWAARVPVTASAFAGLGFLFISEGRFARFARPLVFRTFRWLLNRPGAHSIVQNDDDARVLREAAGVAPEKITVIRGSGVDVERFRPAPEPEGPPVAVAVARLLWDKGLGELVAAARLLEARGVALRIRIVGPGDDNPAAIPAATLDDWRREGIVDLPGASGDVAGVYAGAHIAVLPSYREGLPKALLEAAACGRPMVATDVPGCRDICRDGRTGLLVPPRTVEALADALQRLAEDPALRARFGAAARRLAQEEFTTDHVAAETVALWNRLLVATGAVGPVHDRLHDGPGRR